MATLHEIALHSRHKADNDFLALWEALKVMQDPFISATSGRGLIVT